MYKNISFRCKFNSIEIDLNVAQLPLLLKKVRCCKDARTQLVQKDPIDIAKNKLYVNITKHCTYLKSN